jgi:hypothetical protein
LLNRKAPELERFVKSSAYSCCKQWESMFWREHQGCGQTTFEEETGMGGSIRPNGPLCRTLSVWAERDRHEMKWRKAVRSTSHLPVANTEWLL